MDEIARHLSISKKTLYQHFRDKDHIVTDYAIFHIDEMKGNICNLVCHSRNAIETLVNISALMKAEMFNNHPSLLFDLQKYHPIAWQKFLEYKNHHVLEEVRSTLKAGIEQGSIRPEINVEVVSRLRLEMIQLPFNTALYPPEEFVFSELMVQLNEVFLYGLFTPAGREEYDRLKAERNLGNTFGTLVPDTLANRNNPVNFADAPTMNITP